MNKQKTTDTTVVIGAGIAGIHTAFQLSQQGQKVLVVDAADGPAQVCSRANAGIVALGHAEAIGSPAAIIKLARALLGLNPALKISQFGNRRLWHWGLHFLRHCTASAYHRNSNSLLRVAEYSATIMNDIETKLPLAYDRSDRGTLYFYQGEREFSRRLQSLQKDTKALQLFEALNKKQLLEIEPALNGLEAQLAGALLSSRDISGDCYNYATDMAARLSATGRVEFAYSSKVISLVTQEGRISAIQLPGHTLPTKNVVLTAGISTPSLLRPLDCNAFIYPVKGYSATYSVLDHGAVPNYSAIDETELVSFARYGNRFRITAMAEFAGDNDELDPKMAQKLDGYTRRLCGSAVDFKSARYRACLRPSTPSSRPYLGRISKVQNLWVNAGHGQLGWTLAAGCGKIVADLICGRSPALGDIAETAPWLEPF